MKYDDYLKAMMLYVRQEDRDYLNDEEKTGALNAAVNQHSMERPLVRWHDIVGTGSYDYDVPKDWTPDFSDLLSVEYPAGNRVRTLIETGDREVVWNGVEWKIRFLSVTPSADHVIRISYSTMHVLSHAADTILEKDFYPVCMLAAAHACRSLAAKYATTSEPTISADVINYGSKRAEWMSQAKALEAEYYRAIGRDAEEKGPTPAMEDADMDPKFANISDYLTHPRARR